MAAALVLVCATQALAQPPALLVEYRSASALTGGATVIRVMENGQVERREESRSGPPAVGHAWLSAADLARVRASVQAARIAPQPTVHRGPRPPDPVSESMTLPRRAHVAWSSGDTAPPAVLSLRALLRELAPRPSRAAPPSSGPPSGPAISGARSGPPAPADS